MRYNIIIGGKAGQGPNVVTEIVSQALLHKGFYVFYSRDYESLIRGGHNFNTLTFSDSPVNSNDSKADILICLDENTENIHKKSLNKNSIILKTNQGKAYHNMYFAGALFKILCLDFVDLENQLKKLKNFSENIKEAKEGYENQKKTLQIYCKLGKKEDKELINGSQAIALSSVKSGLEYYYGYPMTPATPLMMELGQMQLIKNKETGDENKHKVIELESEIAVINAALGSSLVGGISMAGSSGGGYDLMTEALSMSGEAEIPIVVYLASRGGYSSTGLATYTGQGDMKVALHGGHGEFFRLVLAPGDSIESMNITNLCFYFSQKYRVPCILLADKHLAESKFTLFKKDEPKLLEIKKSITKPERFNSYEHDRTKDNNATESALVTSKNIKIRIKKQEEIEKEAEKFEMFKVYGNKNAKNLVISWGSTKGAIIDALKLLDEKKIEAKFLQIIFLNPFSKKIADELKKYKPENVFVVENNATSPLSSLISEKIGIIIQDKNKILKYDGRPFLADKLANEIKERMGGRK